jgi:hypothetical protein
MRQRSFSRLAVIGWSALLLCQPSAAFAQIDEARGTNWDNAKRLYVIIVDAAAASPPKRDEGYKATSELAANLDYVEAKLVRIGGRLHEKDRAWLGSRHSEAIDRLKQARVGGGVLGVKLKEVGSSHDSELRDFKSRWVAFVESFDRLWVDFSSHGKELNDILLAFRQECRQCS